MKIIVHGKSWWSMLFVCLVVLAVAAAPVQAQEEGDKKVIQKTVDEQGFEKEVTEVDMMHQTAAQYMSAGQWDRAASVLENVVANEPDRLGGWQDLAKCYKMLKQYDKAARAYNSASNLQPENLDLLSNLGFAQLSAELTDDAMATYERMLTIDALNYDANVHLGFLYQTKGDKAQAIVYYEKALEGNANDVQSMGTLAKLYSDVAESDKSIAMYERAIEAATDEQKNQLRSKLGSSLIAAKNYGKSAEVFGALVEANPENAPYRFNLAISLMQLKRHKDAAAHMEKVVELRPDYVDAYQQLGAIYNETGKYSKAIKIVKSGLSMTDKKAGLYCTWGRSLEKMEQFDEAIDIFQQAVSDPQWGDYARKQIKRQQDLKKRAKAIRDQQGM